MPVAGWLDPRPAQGWTTDEIGDTRPLAQQPSQGWTTNEIGPLGQQSTQAPPPAPQALPLALPSPTSGSPPAPPPRAEQSLDDLTKPLLSGSADQLQALVAVASVGLAPRLQPPSYKPREPGSTEAAPGSPRGRGADHLQPTLCEVQPRAPPRRRVERANLALSWVDQLVVDTAPLQRLAAVAPAPAPAPASNRRNSSGDGLAWDDTMVSLFLHSYTTLPCCGNNLVVNLCVFVHAETSISLPCVSSHPTKVPLVRVGTAASEPRINSAVVPAPAVVPPGNSTSQDSLYCDLAVVQMGGPTTSY